MFTVGEELTEEEADEIIRKVAEKIHLYGMETVAILTLESVKPLAFIGGEMSRIVLAPFLPALGQSVNELGDKLITVFEDRENIEKLITLLEEMARGDYDKEDEKPETGAHEESSEETETDADSENKRKPKKRKSWRDWLPF